MPQIDTEITDILIEWGMPTTMRAIHPIYFAKCLTKVRDKQLLKNADTTTQQLEIVKIVYLANTL
jgi:hypothetical protein